VNQNYDTLGFESTYFINNMGTMFLYFLVFPVMVIVDFTVRLVIEIGGRKSTQSFSESLRKKIYWNLPIRLVLESYANVIICCFIQFQNMSTDSVGQSIQSFTAVSAFAGLVLFAIYWSYQTVSRFSSLEDQENVDKFIEFYDLLTLKKGPKVVIYPMFFMMRRILFGLAIVLLDNMICF